MAAEPPIDVRSPERVRLIADAIRATAYLNDDPVLLLHKLVDYLRLALPVPTDIWICAKDDPQGGWLSTAVAGYFSAKPADECEVCALGPLLFAFKSVLEITGEAWTEIAVLPKRVVESLNTIDQAGADRILTSAERGLRIVLDVARERRHQRDSERLTYSERDTVSLRDLPHQTRSVVVDAARDLAQAVAPIAARFSLVMRYFDFEAKQWQAVSIVPSAAESEGASGDMRVEALEPAWRDHVNRAFETGFLYWAPASSGIHLLAVPVHFGGVPWVVLCHSYSYSDHSWWTAYAAYRDITPKATEAIRQVGQYSLSSALLRIFDEASDDESLDTEQLRLRVEERWRDLLCVFPISAPRLAPVLRAERADLHLRNVPYKFDFSAESANPFQAGAVIRSPAGEAWGALAASSVFRAVFLDPLLLRQLIAHAHAERKAHGEAMEILSTVTHEIASLFNKHFSNVRSELEAIQTSADVSRVIHAWDTICATAEFGYLHAKTWSAKHAGASFSDVRTRFSKPFADLYGRNVLEAAVRLVARRVYEEEAEGRSIVIPSLEGGSTSDPVLSPQEYAACYMVTAEPIRNLKHVKDKGLAEWSVTVAASDGLLLRLNHTRARGTYPESTTFRHLDAFLKAIDVDSYARLSPAGNNGVAWDVRIGPGLLMPHGNRPPPPEARGSDAQAG